MPEPQVIRLAPHGTLISARSAPGISNWSKNPRGRQFRKRYEWFVTGKVSNGRFDSIDAVFLIGSGIISKCSYWDISGVDLSLLQFSAKGPDAESHCRQSLRRYSLKRVLKMLKVCRCPDGAKMHRPEKTLPANVREEYLVKNLQRCRRIRARNSF
jgi:hypothetical protein